MWVHFQDVGQFAERLSIFRMWVNLQNVGLFAECVLFINMCVIRQCLT
jgi:hypothetical protein